jgi:hypothetical protein
MCLKVDDVIQAEFTFFNRLRCSKRSRPSMQPSEVSSSGIVRVRRLAVLET